MVPQPLRHSCRELLELLLLAHKWSPFVIRDVKNLGRLLSWCARIATKVEVHSSYLDELRASARVSSSVLSVQCMDDSPPKHLRAHRAPSPDLVLSFQLRACPAFWCRNRSRRGVRATGSTAHRKAD